MMMKRRSPLWLTGAVLLATQKLSAQSFVDEFTHLYKKSSIISPKNLPSPYNVLLTQPLMTKAIAQHYQRTPIIQPLYAQLNKKNNSYNRIIVMLVDKNKSRNQAEKAQENNEALIVELAFIEMNFNELPKQLINEVMHTTIPFGTLLIKYQIPIMTANRQYFVTRCNEFMSDNMHCHLGESLYGRMNTINNAHTKKWLAHVVEILPRFNTAL